MSKHFTSAVVLGLIALAMLGQASAESGEYVAPQSTTLAAPLAPDATAPMTVTETLPLVMSQQMALAMRNAAPNAPTGMKRTLSDGALPRSWQWPLLGACLLALLLALASKRLSVRAAARQAPDGAARAAAPAPAKPAHTPPQGPTMPKRPDPSAFMPRFQNIASADLLALAQRLADEQATPGAIVEALKTLELPITPLPEEWAGVISVTGHSAKGWNEDSAVAFFVDHWLLGACDVLMVFDGMGGLRDGKLASKLAALTMAIELNRTPDTVPSDLQSHLVAAFERVNRRFKKASETLYGKVDSDAMRSTAIVLLATQTHYVVGHQGDGQAHVRRADGTVSPLISAHKGGASNVITHSLGPQPDGQASVSKHLRRPGDLVYIASDGFDPLPADQALAFLHDHSERHAMQVVAQGLTDAALGQRDEHGPIADDNMSLVALRTPASIDLAPPTAGTPTDDTPKEHTP